MLGVVATTTWNSGDLIEEFLVHYHRLGFQHVFVMDFDSSDGTRDILTSSAWRPFVTLVPFPGIAQLDSSNVLLAVAKETLEPDTWCLFCDPDELLVTPAMTVGHLAGRGADPTTECLTIPRFNMTGPVSAIRSDELRASHVESLTLRIDRRCHRSPGVDLHRNTLDPPWIFTAILPKVFVRVRDAVSVGDGDHIARTRHQLTREAPAGVYLLHYPFRGYAAFQGKVELARTAFASNPHHPDSYGWQIRRWVRLAEQGRLHEEYLAQFIPDEEVARLLQDSTLCRDLSIVS